MKQKTLIKTISSLALVLSLSIGSFAQGLTEGINLIYKEKYKAAAEFFNAKLSSDAKNPEVYYRLGEISFLQGKIDDAKAQYEKGIAADPNFALNNIGVAKVFLSKKDTASARPYINKVLDMQNIKQNSLDLAEAFANTGQNLNEGVALVQNSMKPDKKNAKAPKNPYGYYVLGLLYLQLNNGSEAIKNFELTCDLDQKNVKARLGCAAVYNTIKNYDEAKGYYLKALGIDSTDPVANKEFADYYYEYIKEDKGIQYQKALYYYGRYIFNSEKSVSNLYRYATLFYLTRDYANTVKVLNEFMTMDDKNYGALRLLAYSNYELKNDQAAVDVFKKYFTVAEESKTIASDYEKYGRALLAIGDTVNAFANYQKCVEKDSTQTDLLSEAGNTYYSVKNYADAAKYYEMRVEKGGKPKFIEYFKTGDCYLRLKEFKKADTSFALAAELLPKEPAPYWYRARCNDNLDSTGMSAKPFYEKAIELSVDPKKHKNILIDSYDFLARLAIKQDDLKLAKEYYEKILVVDPENEVVKQMLSNTAFKKIK
jgi:tetratricopeptide (TPR) repeat protein